MNRTQRAIKRKMREKQNLYHDLVNKAIAHKKENKAILSCYENHLVTKMGQEQRGVRKEISDYMCRINSERSLVKT